MPNDLTGDFDVVAQFAIPAVNRVLATMHRYERFPHSVAIRVDDTDRPWGPGGFRPSAVAAVDRFGETLSDHQRIQDPRIHPGLLASTDIALVTLDPVVNLDNSVLGLPPLEPSNLKGRAQLQLFPPTIDVLDASGTNVTVRIALIGRYFPDQNTSPMAEYIRGELRVTAPVSQVASQAANVIEIDIKSANVTVAFVPHWTSRPLTAQDIGALNLFIRNTLKTSFLPSNSTLPPNVAHMQFKTMHAGGKAIAVLLDLDGGPSDRNSANNIFLGGGDDFAVGVSSDFVRAAFEPTIEKILSTPVDPVSFKLSNPVYTWNITYRFTLTSASVELRNDEIVLLIKGNAKTGSWTPNFDFTVTQKFSLAVDGSTADLVVGDISIDTSSWIIDRFRGGATGTLRRARDRAMSDGSARRAVRKMLSADESLGGFLNSMLVPPTPSPLPPGRFALAYTAAEIRPVGITLRGMLSAPEWPAAHVEFVEIPNAGGGQGHPGIGSLFEGPTYSALKSWIPGGTIQRYEWKSFGQTQPGRIDENTFIYRKLSPGIAETFETVASPTAPPPITATPVTGYRPLCVVVSGTRLSASGPVVAQPVTASVCAIKSFPVFEVATDGIAPMIALARPGRGGNVEVTGQTPAPPSIPGRALPNLVVHFGDRSTAGNLESLVDALAKSGRIDAPTAIVAVLTRDDLRAAKYADGVTYADDTDGSWERRYERDVSSRPVTLIVAPNGKVVSKHHGGIEADAFAEVLRKSLVAGRQVATEAAAPAVRIGRRPPNFLFQYAPGHELTLRKTVGRPVTLVFWRSSSRESIEAARDLASMNPDGTEFLVLAINDGEPAEAAKRAASENKFEHALVVDASRNISSAYGVNAWPTIISLDAEGATRSIRQGMRDTGADSPSMAEQAGVTAT